MFWHYNEQSCQQFQVLRCSSSVLISEPATASSGQSQRPSLDDSGRPLNNVNVRRMSLNFCNLSGYFSPPTRLPPIAGSQMLARAIVSFYYSYNTTYVIDLNSVEYESTSGFCTQISGTKSATLPMCYTPLTRMQFFDTLNKLMSSFF